MTDQEPSTSSSPTAPLALNSKFSVKSLTTPTPAPIFPFPPEIFHFLLQSAVSSNILLDATQTESPPRKRKRKATPKVEKETAEAEDEEEEPKPGTSKNLEIAEKDLAQQLLLDALTQAGQTRAEKLAKQSSQVSPDNFEQKRSASNNLAVSKNGEEKIKLHPMYPVLELMQDKLTQATYDLRPSAFQMDDVKKTGNYELDNLMANAIHMLRVQLAELQRVSKLSDDFKNKFAAAIKTRVNLETLIGQLCDSDDENGAQYDQDAMPCAFPPNNTTLAMMNTPQGTFSIPLQMPPLMFPLQEEYGFNSPQKRPRLDFGEQQQFAGPSQ